MALKLNERYPGRFNNPTADYPQGSFKNRSAPGAKDGSYLEKDWANDKEGFFQSLLKNANITPNSNVDTALSSQYYSALATIFLSASGTAYNSDRLGGQLPAYYATASSLTGKLDITNGLGQTQTWQSVTRTAGVTYTNTTGKPILLSATIYSTLATVTAAVTINGLMIEFASCQSQLGPTRASGTIIIPPAATYVISETNVTTRYYSELR